MDLIANYESRSESENEEIKPSQKLKSYSTEFKLKVVKHAKDISKHSASIKFGISRSCVQGWIRQDAKLHQIKNSSPAGKFKKKLRGGGRPLIFKDLDEQLAVWVRNQRAEKKRISHSILQQQAITMFNAEEDENGFKLTDLASMLISLFSLYLASRPASQRMSFGWHRAEVVGAFISVFMIWVVTGILVYLAVDRMITGNYDINPTIMAITAGVGVMVNLCAIYILVLLQKAKAIKTKSQFRMGALLYFGGHSHSHIGGGSHTHTHGSGNSHSKPSGRASRTHSLTGNASNFEDTEATGLLSSVPSTHFHDGTDNTDCEEEGGHRAEASNINVRAAFIHVLGDLIQSVGVLIASLVILWNENLSVVDPICTLLFSVIVVSTTVYIVRDALVVLLEGRPSNIDFRVVFDALEKIEGVRKVHDLRIWALTMDKLAISVHLEIAADAMAQTVLKNTTLMLRKDFNVHESTVQIEGWQAESENCFQCIIPTR